MALFSKRNIQKINTFNLRPVDFIGEITYVPYGVLIRMMQEQELQGNEPDVTVFQRSSNSMCSSGGFDWENTKDGEDFWFEVITEKNWCLFYERYPEYENLKWSV